MQLSGALFCVDIAIYQITKQVFSVCMREDSAPPLHGEMDICNMLEGCLMVLVTSLSVLTTEGWMMVALQGTAATGGLNEDFREVFKVSARIDSVSLKSHK